MGAGRIETEVHTRFESCEAELRELINHSLNNNPFLTLDWLKLWWAHFGQDRNLHLLLFRQGEHLVGFAPFYRVDRPMFHLSEYRFLGHETSNYLDIVCLPGFEEAVVDSLLAHFSTMSTPSIVHLHDINDRFSQCYASLSRKLSEDGWYASVFKLYPCPMAHLGDDWDTFFQHQRSRKSRKNLRRSERQLSQIGSWCFREVTDPSEFSCLFPQMERLHAERFRETINPLLTGSNRDFLFSALRQLVASQISLSVIELDGVLVSFLIGFKMGDVFVDYAPAFDPALASFSLGQIHLMQLMKKKLDEGFKYFDFSKGEAPYKRWWSNKETTNYLFLLGFNLGSLGLLYIKWLELTLRIILAIREKGYNKRIKQWVGMLQNRTLLARRKSRVRIQEIQESSIDSTSPSFPWSYQRIQGLPVEARKAIVERVIKLDPRSVKVSLDSERRTGKLLSDNGNTDYLIRY